MTRAEEILLKEMRYIASISNGQVKRVAEGALASVSEYLATEPSGERAALIEKLRLQKRWLVGAQAVIALMEEAADMLEADAQPKSFIRERAQLEQEWCELRKLKQAQQATDPSCPSCQSPGLMYECVYCSANSYPKGFAQQAKRVPMTPAEKPTDWSAA